MYRAQHCSHANSVTKQTVIVRLKKLNSASQSTFQTRLLALYRAWLNTFHRVPRAHSPEVFQRADMLAHSPVIIAPMGQQLPERSSSALQRVPAGQAHQARIQGVGPGRPPLRRSCIRPCSPRTSGAPIAAEVIHTRMIVKMTRLLFLCLAYLMGWVTAIYL